MKPSTPPVMDITLKPDTTIAQLVKQMDSAGGFVAKKLADAAHILEDMEKDKKCLKFLSFPACIIATGARGIIKQMVKEKMVDVIITTCGTLDHDLARLWRKYYHGDFMMDDAALYKKGINRLGNVLVPNESYGVVLEQKLIPILQDLYDKGIKKYSTKEIIWEVGKRIADEPGHEDSILYWAWKNQIPIFVPGPTDGSFGAQIWSFYQEHRDVVLDILKDEQDLSDMVFTAKKSGALMIGGGISKHHVIWWNQFKDGLDYAVYITTAPEWDGSLSGARMREAVSWGKVKEKAKYITVEGDATVILPLLIGYLVAKK
ncbi:MAG: deoxyhypusine synthase [Thermoplasmata archaeon HGW-Thermoplasmata-2]|nr:MAG: deoxyhypusine synthase [Thermoplasmata archaeon HGW-Thermoplasmata-2]